MRVVSLSEAAVADLSLVGGKARNLGRLESAGFRVPPALVVTTEAGIDEVDLSRRLDDIGPGPYAVRSSGVSEDGARQSLAGRYESILDVPRHAVPDAVKKVRAFALGRDKDHIGVVIQQMVEAKCAGVAFTADPVTGDRSKTVITATPGLAEKLVAGEVPGEEWEVSGSRLEARRRPKRILSRRLVRRIARTASLIGEEFGGPQDIEWAWDGRELWVVQTRPITGLPEEVGWDPPAPGIYHRSLRLGEWIPGPVTPLFESWLVTRIERGVHDYLYRHIGQVAPEPLHVVVNGWYYYSLNWLPIPGVAFRKNLANISRRLPGNWRKVAAMFPPTIRFAAVQEFEDEFYDDILPSYRQAVADAEGRIEQMSPPELVATIDQLSDLAGLYFGSIAVVAGSAYKFEAQLAQFWNRHLKKDLEASHMVVLRGFDLPDTMGSVPQLETLDWWRPPLDPVPSSHNTEKLRLQRLETESRANQLLAASPRKRARFSRLLTSAQRMVPIREEQLGLLAIGWPVMRRAVQRLGETLAARGSIDEAEDAFFLTRTEVEDNLEEPRSMQRLVQTRRDELARANRLTAPIWVGKVPPIVRFLFGFSGKTVGATRSEDAIVHGVPASPGRATGKVRVVTDSSQFHAFQDGEVLVAPLTAPAWTVLFARAAAVVTDVGSALAHASIIAREYGIPAVVGCSDATSRLRDGQMVTVDGSTGNVELAEDRFAHRLSPTREIS
ncbi:MAG: PEP/pyruvate-binding domain-containing protein [Acidimicrobiia bacterium]|nr:PEP/pyruvate-binding domain-containing protein [Acidimicrobiia bacterium]